jgi:hypothetical protein
MLTSLAERVFREHDTNHDGILPAEVAMQALEYVLDGAVPVGLFGDILDHADRTNDQDGMDLSVFLDAVDTALEYKATTATKEEVGLFPRIQHFLHHVLPSLLEHQQRIERNIVGEDCLINPTGGLHFVWEIILSVTIQVLLITIPLTIGWDELARRLFPVNMLLDVVCILDIVKNFTTGTVNEHDVVVMDAAVVRNNYLSGYFAFDLVGSIPFDLFFFAAGCLPSQPYNRTRHPLKMLKVLRITKLFRMRRASRFYQWIKSFADPLEEHMSLRISDGLVKSCDCSCLRELWRIGLVVSTICWCA